ncbi:MAG: glycosyltransferase family 39 protein [Actinomycetota bacterium]
MNLPTAIPAAVTAPAPATSARPTAGIALIAAAAVAVELAVSARYGYQRDELYFLSAGHHLTFGYVDQPALTPLLARLAAAVSGNSLIGLRVLPALALGVLVVLTAAISRRLGAGRAGQLLAALATATCAEYLGAMHLLTTTVPDMVAWAVLLYLVMRLLASQDPRWWLAVGGTAGIAADAKWNVAFLLAALLAGFLLTPARGLLKSRYLLAGAVIAAVLGSPDVIWQAMHGWPNLAVFHALQGDAGHNRMTYWIAQIVYTGVAISPVWVAGLVWSLRSEACRRFRPLALASVIAVVLAFVLGGKPYYSGAVYVFLIAAGSVPLERWLAARRPLRGRLSGPAGMAVTLVISGAIGALVALPVLPAATLHTFPLQKINYDLGETIAWPRLVALVSREYHALPAQEQRHTTILAGNYGEAGAIERYGAQYGLPTAYSGANNFWLWGPPPAADTSAIAINLDESFLRTEFAHVKLVATFTNGIGVDDDEQGTQVFAVSGLRSPWRTAWPAFRHYS